jgi:transposase InsO family protein
MQKQIHLDRWGNLLKPHNYYFPSVRRGRELLSRYERWRKVAKTIGLSKRALLRLEWMIYYHTKAEGNASLTSRHFGIARKTFYLWYNRFDEAHLASLEEHSRAPIKRREKEYTPEQYIRFISLRLEYIRYGKVKLLIKYQEKYPEDTSISLWKIQCMLTRAKIYYNPIKQGRTNRKRTNSVKRKKVTDLKKKKQRGFLVCLDTIVQYWNGKKRYIITGIDRYSKIAFARMYTTHSSKSAEDFLYRMYYLLDGKIVNIQTDNGSEFKKHFHRGLEKLSLPQYHSRIKTPKDNPVIERFNRTLQDEFLNLGNMTYDTKEFNRRLLEWLIEYNFRRPHQTLDYIPPVNFHFKYYKVLPMYPSSTKH